MKMRQIVIAFSVVACCVGPMLGASAAAATVPSSTVLPGPVDFGPGSGVSGNGGNGTVDGSGNQDGSPADNGGPRNPGAGNCIGCTYRWTSVCDPTVANAACGAFVGACPPGFVMETLVINNPALPNPTLGVTECRSATGATPAQVRQAAVDAFSQLLTTAHPTQQPGGGSLVNLPTLFATNTPQTQTFNETLLGVPVTLNVQASWTWDFGDGTTVVSTIPGGQYPDTSLSHIYLAARQYTIQLTTNWTGTFSMAGGVAAAIPGGSIPRVSNPFALDVHEARGVLVTG
jgi:PKD domain